MLGANMPCKRCREEENSSVRPCPGLQSRAVVEIGAIDLRRQKVAKITSDFEIENPGLTILEVGQHSQLVDLDYADFIDRISFRKMHKDGRPLFTVRVDYRLAILLHSGAAEALFNGKPLSKTVLHPEWVAPTVFENFQEAVLSPEITDEVMRTPLYKVLLPYVDTAYVRSMAAICAIRYYCFGQAPDEPPGTRLHESWDIATWEGRMNEIRDSSVHLQSSEATLDACIQFNTENLKYDLVFERKLLDDLEIQLELLAEQVGMAEELLHEINPNNPADMARFTKMRQNLKTAISRLNKDPLSGAAHDLRAVIA